MACFLVTHRVTGEFSQQDLLTSEKRVIGHLPREIKWVMSWYEPERNEVVAHWDAPTVQAVRVALERSGVCETLPILAIEPAIELYPKRYVARREAARHRAAANPGAPSSAQKRSSHAPREWSGTYAEAVSSVLQARGTSPHGSK